LPAAERRADQGSVGRSRERVVVTQAG
jgi:hypothetical protein